jgi:hypothetical protein
MAADAIFSRWSSDTASRWNYRKYRVFGARPVSFNNVRASLIQHGAPIPLFSLLYLMSAHSPKHGLTKYPGTLPTPTGAPTKFRLQPRVRIDRLSEGAKK